MNQKVENLNSGARSLATAQPVRGGGNSEDLSIENFIKLCQHQVVKFSRSNKSESMEKSPESRRFEF